LIVKQYYRIAKVYDKIGFPHSSRTPVPFYRRKSHVLDINRSQAKTWKIEITTKANEEIRREIAHDMNHLGGAGK